MISPSWGFPPRRRQRWGESDCSRASGGAPACGQPVATDPKPSPDLAVALALPGRCLVGLRSPPAAPGPRSRASVHGRRSWRRTRSGPAPGGADPPQAVGQTRAGRGGGTHRRDLRRPKGPKVSVKLHGQLSDPLHGLSFRLHRIALALLERGVDPADRFLTPLLRAGNLTPNWRVRSCTGRHAKAADDLTCAPPSIAGQVPAGLPWPGENVRTLARIYHRPINSNFLLKIPRSCSGPPWTLRLSQLTCVQAAQIG